MLIGSIAPATTSPATISARSCRLRKIITEEMQLRFSSMQVDIFALLTEARQRLASLRGAIDAKQKFFLAQSDLQTAVNGGGAPARRRQFNHLAAAAPADGGH